VGVAAVQLLRIDVMSMGIALAAGACSAASAATKQLPVRVETDFLFNMTISNCLHISHWAPCGASADAGYAPELHAPRQVAIYSCKNSALGDFRGSFR
jgi:hypothetical protein